MNPLQFRSPEQQLHEDAAIRAFIQRPRQERALLLLSSKTRRRDYTRELAHFGWLDEHFAHTIPSTVAHTMKEKIALLRSKGAGPTVWSISEDRDIDGKELDLEVAMEHIYGRGIGTLLSCIPGKLGYFEDEEKRFLLERK